MNDKHGTLTVRSNPSGAIASVNNKSKMTPAMFDLIEKKLPYKVTIEMYGYEDYFQKVLIQRGSKIEISAVLTEKRK